MRLLIHRPNAVDGLAHLGGFAMGILLGTILYPSISETKAHRFALWGARVVALVLVIVAFALTTKNFCKPFTVLPAKYESISGVCLQSTNSYQAWFDFAVTIIEWNSDKS